jgi:hypothetical protein
MEGGIPTTMIAVGLGNRGTGRAFFEGCRGVMDKRGKFRNSGYM